MEPVRVVDGKLIFALRVPPGVLVAELPGTITEAVTDTDRLRSQVQKPFGVTTPFVIEHNCAPSAVVVYSFLALKGSVTVRLLVIAARQCEVGEFVTENQRPDLTVLPEPFRTLRRKALGLSPCSCCPENVPTFPSKFTSHPTVWRGPRFPDYEHAFVIERAVGIVERALNKDASVLLIALYELLPYAVMHFDRFSAAQRKRLVKLLPACECFEPTLTLVEFHFFCVCLMLSASNDMPDGVLLQRRVYWSVLREVFSETFTPHLTSARRRGQALFDADEE